MRGSRRIVTIPLWIVVFRLCAGCGDSNAPIEPLPVHAGGTAIAGSHPGPGGEGGADHSGGSAGSGGEAGGPEPPPPCTVQAPTACPDPWPVYADVEPVFSEHCVRCHKGLPDGPWPLTNYGHVTAWRDEIRAALLTCAMPPPEEGTPLPEADSLLILTWIRCGMPP